MYSENLIRYCLQNICVIYYLERNTPKRDSHTRHTKWEECILIDACKIKKVHETNEEKNRTRLHWITYIYYEDHIDIKKNWIFYIENASIQLQYTSRFSCTTKNKKHKTVAEWLHFCFRLLPPPLLLLRRSHSFSVLFCSFRHGSFCHFLSLMHCREKSNTEN